MDIKVLRDFLHGTHRYRQGDVCHQVDDLVGRYFCDAGWAEDLSGAYPTGNPGPNTVLAPHSAVLSATSTKP